MSIEGKVFDLTAMDPPTNAEFLKAAVPASPEIALSAATIPLKFDIYLTTLEE